MQGRLRAAWRRRAHIGEGRLPEGETLEGLCGVAATQCLRHGFALCGIGDVGIDADRVSQVDMVEGFRKEEMRKARPKGYRLDRPGLARDNSLQVGARPGEDDRLAMLQAEI